ncbi:MAG: DNA recombination/repair protein RecA [Acidobacteriota bacterium]|nr:DNA recombination/repair protein RecA [Acidobacteriota bacterium]
MANTMAALRCSDLWKTGSELKALGEYSGPSTLEIPKLQKVLPRGLRRGTIHEIHGLRSSGRTSFCMHILAQATAAGEVCAVVDLFDSFDPLSASAAGVQLERVVWVRCQGNAEHAIRTSDLLVHAGGFGVICLDLCEAPPRALNRIPLSYWHRFRRAVEQTPTLLLVCADSPQAKSSQVNSLQAKLKAISWVGKEPLCRFSGLEAYATPSKILSLQPPSLFLKSCA